MRPGDPDEETTRLREIRSLHSKYPLSCASLHQGGLLGFDDSILSYIRSLMGNRTAQPPHDLPDRWEDVLACLRCHWINPFLYWRIMSVPREMRPTPRVMDDLKCAYRVSMISQLKTEKQLKEISDAFGKVNIDFLVLKGAALSRTIYAEPFVRTGSDIDIMVRPGEVRQARKALESIGYQCIYPYFEVSARLFCEEEFTYREKNARYIPVELHWDRSSIDVLKRCTSVDNYFDRSITIKAGRQDIQVMSMADALISQAVHMMGKHYDGIKLSWINDIAILCRHFEATGSWGEFRSHMRKSNTGPLLRPVLRMAELWAGITVPKDIFIAGSASEKNVEEAFEKLTSGKQGFISNIQARWPAEATALEKFRIAWYFALPPEQIMRTHHFPGKDLSLPAMHMKRWGDIVRRKLRH